MEGLQRGTIFPSCLCRMVPGGRKRRDKEGSEILDKDRKQLLVHIMAEEFTAVEFNLYLDTHPDDKAWLRITKRLHGLADDLKTSRRKGTGP